MIGKRGGGSTLTVGANGADGLVHEPHRGVPPAFPSPLTRSADADLRESRPAPPCAQNTQLPSTPEGSRPAFAWSDVAIGSTPVRPVTGRPSLPPSSFTRRPVGSPHGGPTLAGGRRAYHVASQESSWVRPRLDAGGTSSAPDEFATSGPGHLPFWSKPISTFGLSLFTALAAVHLGWPYHAPLVPDHRGAGSRDLGSRSDRHPRG
jgi:hypothetical protein